jgi:uncharacterized protein YdeI (YjbR/CyaY-like superfamily)
MAQTTVVEYIVNSGRWESSLNLLREILLGSELEETVKWGMPVYTWEGKNIVGMVAFKKYVGLWFYQGVFLRDKQKFLVAAENDTRGLRQWRFHSEVEIRDRIQDIIAYVEEALQNQKKGKEIKPDFNKPIIIPDELKIEFSNDPWLRDAFNALSKSRQRQYTQEINRAKQAATRERRLKKVIQLIKAGRTEGS